MDLQPSPTTRRPQPQAANRPPQRAEQRTWVLHLELVAPRVGGGDEAALDHLEAVLDLAPAQAGLGHRGRAAAVVAWRVPRGAVAQNAVADPGLGALER